MKRVQKLLVASSLAGSSDKTDFYQNALAGQIDAFDAETGTTLTAVSTPNKIVIGVMCEDSEGKRYVEESEIIEMNTPTAFGLKEYFASTAKSVSFDMSAVSIIAGNVYEFWITDYNDYNYIIGRRRISYEAKPGDVLADVVEGLIVACNNDDSIPNVAATWSNGDDPEDPTSTDPGDNIVLITGKAVSGSGSTNVINNFRADYEILFEVVLGENLYGVTSITPVTAADKGCGTFREVRKLEEIHKGYKGYLNRVIYPTSVNIQYKSLPVSQGGPAGYDMYVIEHKAPQYTVTEGDVHFQVSSNIAMNEGAGAALAAILDPVLAQLR
jgi:hypothetical protein